jgi:hypothetical protein
MIQDRLDRLLRFGQETLAQPALLLLVKLDRLAEFEQGSG